MLNPSGNYLSSGILHDYFTRLIRACSDCTDMKLSIVLAICIAITICVSGCTQPASVPNVTPQPTTVVQTFTPVVTVATTTPQPDYVTLISAGNAEIVAGRNSIAAGKAELEYAIGTQGQTVDVQNIMMRSQANFTAAKDQFTAALSYYTQAEATAPSGIVPTLTTMTGTLPSDIRACDTYLAANTAAQHFDWYNANDLLNKANIQFQTAMQTTDQLLAVLSAAS